jgi:hypothetical protein
MLQRQGFRYWFVADWAGSRVPSKLEYRQQSNDSGETGTSRPSPRCKVATAVAAETLRNQDPDFDPPLESIEGVA